jgi:hypothetical protein
MGHRWKYESQPSNAFERITFQRGTCPTVTQEHTSTHRVPMSGPRPKVAEGSNSVSGSADFSGTDHPRGNSPCEPITHGSSAVKFAHGIIGAVVLLAILTIVYGMSLNRDTTTAAMKSTASPIQESGR